MPRPQPHCAVGRPAWARRRRACAIFSCCMAMIPRPATCRMPSRSMISIRAPSCRSPATCATRAQLLSGREITSPPHFFIGCADAPIDPPDNWEPKGLEAKIAAGAQFAQTQFCFDAALAERYFARLEALGITKRLKIIAGIGPLLSAKQARFMNEKLFGVSIPAGDHRPARSGERSQGRGPRDLRRTDRTLARR